MTTQTLAQWNLDPSHSEAQGIRFDMERGN